MEEDREQRSLEELAMIAGAAAKRSEDNLLSDEEKGQAKLEKQIALTELISELMERISIELPKRQGNNLSQYIYEEALQEVLLYVCKNIEKYDPEELPFLAWIRFMFKWRKIDVFNWLTWKGRSIYQNEDDASKDVIERYLPPDANPLPSIEVIEFIKKDPEGLFSTKLFKKNPKASFQIIALKKCEEEKTWNEIVQELELGRTHGPVSTFYRRNCEKFRPYFKKYLGEELT